MRKASLFLVAAMTLLVAGTATAQIYLTPNVGFKSYGLKGATTIAAGGQIRQMGIFDAGKTSINFGVGIGYPLLKIPSGIYRLDMLVDVSYASANMAEAGYNYAYGPGKFSSDGNSGGSTSNLAFDLMPVHTINIPGFSLISPYAGVGFGLNYFSSGDLSVGPPSSPQVVNVTGKSEFKVGLVVFYGATLNLTGMVRPFIQFKHYIPFGSEFQFTEDATYGSIVIKDTPGYFNLAAGIKLSL
jgi:hypothetical protein